MDSSGGLLKRQATGEPKAAVMVLPRVGGPTLKCQASVVTGRSHLLLEAWVVHQNQAEDVFGDKACHIRIKTSMA